MNSKCELYDQRIMLWLSAAHSAAQSRSLIAQSPINRQQSIAAVAAPVRTQSFANSVCLPENASPHLSKDSRLTLKSISRYAATVTSSPLLPFQFCFTLINAGDPAA